MANIAFIGLGNMGAPMAINLIKAGHNVCVYDLFEEAVMQVVNEGATTKASMVECIQSVDFIITMLPAGHHVEKVYLCSKNGLLSHIEKDTMVIDCSTIDANTAVKVASTLSSQGIGFVDAPVSGGVGGAKAGTLSFMVGASEKEFDKARTILTDMGENIFHAGEHGSGQIAKVCNNMLLSVLMAGTSEALQLGIANGLNPEVLSNIMAKSSGSNWALEKYNPCPNVLENVPSSNNYEGGFMVELMLKDLGLAMETASSSQSSTPLGSMARNLYTMHANAGNKKKDFSSIFYLFSKEQ